MVSLIHVPSSRSAQALELDLVLVTDLALREFEELVWVWQRAVWALANSMKLPRFRSRQLPEWRPLKQEQPEF